MWRTALRVSRLCLRFPGPTCGQVRLPLLPPPLVAEQLCVRREYSSQRPPAFKSMTVVGIPNPLIWLRIKAYSFLIQTFLDTEFTMKEFSVGARQAFVIVSRMLSQNKFEALENLVTKEVLEVMQERCSKLSDNYRKALAAESDKIMYFYPGDIGIYYEENGSKFVSILMRFWYLKDADLLDDEMKGTIVYKIGFGNHDLKDNQCILTANYEFRREFTQGTKPDWIITKIEHSEL